MAESHLKQIWQPFYQVDSSNSRQFEGSGLGLAICKQLVEALGGSVQVQSQLGSGYTVPREFRIAFASLEYG